MDKILKEEIIFGGIKMTRAQALAEMTAEGQSARCIDYFVFGTPAVR